MAGSRGGFFFGRYRGIRDLGGGGSRPPPDTISPSKAWTGEAGSGFVSRPMDPARSTAKPIISLIVPPRHAYTDEHLVGVYAGANENGSMLANMGMKGVIAHYEGSRLEIRTPTFQTFADANGNPITYYAWWIRLKHDGRNGLADIYFEAIARDTAMQRRVIGPYLFLPSDTLYDYDLTVASSQPEIEGSRYNCVKNALTYLRGVSAVHPRIRIIESYTGDLSGPTSSYVGAGYCTIEAKVPVVIRKTYETRGVLRFAYDRLRFRGSNITFDMRYISRFRPHRAGNFQFDGVNFINTGGRDELWEKGMRPAAHLVSYAESKVSPWFTECTFNNTANSAMQRSYARGCMFNNIGPDLADACRLLLGCTVNDMDNSEFRKEILALRVQYVGRHESATLSISGTLGANSRTVTAKVAGETVGTFTLGGTAKDFHAGSNYNVMNVVDWLNSLVDWRAKLLDDTRKAVQLSLPETNGNNFVDTDAKSNPLTLVTQFDYHPDIMQRTSKDENIVIAENTIFNMVGQAIFLNIYDINDMLIVNNAFADKPNLAESGYYSQLSSRQSHVVIAHNSLATQGMLIRTDKKYSADSYCLIANNTMPTLKWYGAPDNRLKIFGNHLHRGATEPAGAKGTTISGDETTLFVNALMGDFGPGAPLLSAKRQPVLRYDQHLRGRAGISCPGASA